MYIHRVYIPLYPLSRSKPTMVEYGFMIPMALLVSPGSQENRLMAQVESHDARRHSFGVEKATSEVQVVAA